MTDLDLLQRYLREGSQSAFSAVVGQYTDLVYSAALRQVRSPDFAREVTQTVFLELSVQAGKLRPGTHLGSWLYVATRRSAIDLIRREATRLKREQAALEIAAMKSSPSLWSELEPWLDEAIASLDAADRQAVLLRFFENKSLEEIGRALGSSENAAQKRVSRAVDRLRGLLAKRGITTTAAVIASEVSLHAVQPAPVGLAGAVSSGIALPAAAVGHAAALSTAKTAVWTFAKTTMVAAALATVLVGGLLYEVIGLRSQQARATALAAGLMDLQTEARQLRAARDLALAQKANSDQVEAKRVETGAALDGRLSALVARAGALKRRIDQHPEQSIPELKLLENRDWLTVAQRYATLDSDADFALALSALREKAKSHLFSIFQEAMDAYLKANRGQLPANVSELISYLPASFDRTILERYEMRATGLAAAASGVFIGEKPGTAIDSALDAVYELKQSGASLTQAGVRNIVEPDVPEELWAAARVAGQAYLAAHQGQPAKGIDELGPYFEDQKTAGRFFEALFDPWPFSSPDAKNAALRLFRADHFGSYPAKPEDLAPYFSESGDAAKFLKAAKNGDWLD